MEGTDELESELARSCESAGRLLANLAEKIGANPVVRNAAQYWEEHPARAVVRVVNRAIGRNPLPALMGALLVGFLLGRAVELHRRDRLG